jgi:proton-translocating NADH-quinone oxidoreductase chain M
MNTIFILVPIFILVGCIVVTMINKNEEVNFYNNYIGTLSIFIIYCWMFISLNYTIYDKQYSIKIESLPNIFGTVELCIDGLSSFFLLLTAFLFPLCLLYNRKKTVNQNQYSILLLLVELLLIICFTASNFFVFYIAFEIILFPMVFIIGFWGSRGRRVHAVYLFFFYTMLGSFILLACLFVLYRAYGTLEFNHFFNKNGLSILEQQILSFFIFLGFSIKIPMYPLHLWLPEAHVEAPTVGSVILAGILLKLGGYGMLRVFMPISQNVLADLKYYFITITLVSIVLGAMAALRQIDLKKVIAYSSVVHMNVGVLGLFAGYNAGIIGFIFLMISHGIISSGLFFGVGMLYDRLHTKNFAYLGGLTRIMPKFSMLFFLLVIANMSIPGTSNFIGEISIFLSLILEKVWLVTIVAIVSSFFTTLFCCIIIVKTLYSYLYKNIDIIYDVTDEELFILGLCVLLIFILGIFPGIITEYMIEYGNYYNVK